MKTTSYERIVFGASAVFYGAMALRWYDAQTWQTLAEIWKLPIGRIVGGCLMAAQIAGGIGIQFTRTTRLASIVLVIVYLSFSLACVPGILSAPGAYAEYPNFFEQFSLLCAAIALCGNDSGGSFAVVPTGLGDWPHGEGCVFPRRR